MTTKLRPNHIIVMVCLTLAGCGADGPPKPPSASPAQPGMIISGDAQIGVVSN